MRRHWMAATALGFMAFCITMVFVVVKTHASKTVNVSASTANVTPTAVISAVTNDARDTGSATSTVESDGTALTLIDGSSVKLHVTGTVTDDNGYTDITGLYVILYHAADFGSADCVSAGVGTTPDNAHCAAISGSTCTQSSCSGTSCNFDCYVPVWYNADSTGTGGRYEAESWSAVVAPLDTYLSANPAGMMPNISSPRTFEIAPLTALSLSGDISFGQMDLGATTSSVPLIISNTGNKFGEGVSISGSAMTCTVGTIATSSIKFATSNVAYGSMTALNDDGTPVSSGLSMATLPATTTEMTSTTYFNLQTPSSGVAGTCTGTLTFSAD